MLEEAFKKKTSIKKAFKENFRISNIVPITIKFKGARLILEVQVNIMYLDVLNAFNWNDGGFNRKLCGRVGLNKMYC